ncbi:hypothetical protein CPB84DRAFT_1774651 [Gymnopilus junonius]|uniref:F-box domain-containing protein n=1 Tax=Gymnopilus junonius TaxID=109634 RepID=A0A9P5TQD2_GYMJU|nr:hypothetical protein CPB84DRAFT_1774651 [Gymnopilus junonius]
MRDSSDWHSTTNVIYAESVNPRCDSEIQINMPDIVSTKDCLRRLDDDILLQIFDKLRPQGHLRSLSTICKWIRSLCASILFSECSVKSNELSSGRSHFLPESLWCHVRILRLSGYFLRQKAILSWGRGEWVFPYPDTIEVIEEEKEAQARELRAGTFLEEVLKCLPSLNTVIIDNLSNAATEGPDKAGVPLPVILAILSTPQVQHFSVSGYLYHPVDPSPAPPTNLDLANLTSFIYYIPILQGALLNFIIPALRLSLEKLVLPVENAPLQNMYMEEWPSLRVLTLYGQRRTVVKPCIPYITILARMPKLQSLKLFFANPWNIDPQAIWPEGFHMSFPWPELEQLTVTQPHADDRLWAHLPESLRVLSLRCWPRRWEHQILKRQRDALSPLYHARIRWHTPLLSSSDMLQILRQCQTPFLEHLDIEYQIDNQEVELMQYISSAFPVLKKLEISRYKNEAARTPPLTDIALALAPLKAIRVLCLYFDEQSSLREVKPEIFRNDLDVAAYDLASNMGKTLEVIHLSLGYYPHMGWSKFSVVWASHEDASFDEIALQHHVGKPTLILDVSSVL